MRNFWTKREPPTPPDPQGRSADGQIYIGWDEKQKMNEATAKWTEKPKRPGLFSGLRGFVVTTLLLIGLLYGAIYVIGLMDGFRAFLEDHLKSSLDIRVKITKAWLTPSLNLEFEGLSTENFGRKGMPGLQIQKGKIEWTLADETGWHLPKVRRAVLRGVGVRFAPDDYGRWEPVPLAAVGEKVADWCGFKVAAPKPEKPLPTLEKKSGSDAKAPPDVAEMLRQLRLEIADAHLTWFDADGTELATASKLRLAIQPIILPSREVTHYWLRVDEVTRATGQRAHDIRVEFFDLGEKKIMLELCADWIGLKPTPTPANTTALPVATNAPAFIP